MSKIIDIIRRGTPEDSAYADSIVVLDNGNEIYSGLCSSHCNPYQPRTNKLWYAVYAEIAEGTFGWQCIAKHQKFGRCLLINGGSAIPTTNPNVNHNGKYYAAEIFIHTGDSETWRGSRGCITIPPSKKAFFNIFADGETGKLILRKAAV